MKIREAIGRYAFSWNGSGYDLTAMLPDGSTLEGCIPDFDTLGKQIASVEDQLRAQRARPMTSH